MGVCATSEQGAGGGKLTPEGKSQLDPKLHDAVEMRWSGRVAPGKAKGSVTYDWPGVVGMAQVSFTTTIGVRMSSGSNYFNVFLNGRLHMVLKPGGAKEPALAKDLDPNKTYTIQIEKRTEPSVRGAVTWFSPVTVYGLILDPGASMHPWAPPVWSQLGRRIGECLSRYSLLTVTGTLHTAHCSTLCLSLLSLPLTAPVVSRVHRRLRHVWFRYKYMQVRC